MKLVLVNSNKLLDLVLWIFISNFDFWISSNDSHYFFVLGAQMTIFVCYHHLIQFWASLIFAKKNLFYKLVMIILFICLEIYLSLKQKVFSPSCFLLDSCYKMFYLPSFLIMNYLIINYFWYFTSKGLIKI